MDAEIVAVTEVICDENNDVTRNPAKIRLAHPRCSKRA